ncbi:MULTISPECIES: hypothetical protein [Burkholderia]|uniref:Uncharacterized protein n=1 Tax=Burkholderia pyrrocinia TaxID=60550 RepID=A0A318J020_BURPY|nr:MULTISPECIES: hypothetical protein [Burkholderia]PXX41099.1 hypothetical protein NA66_1001709 [Burkholderia pyrrocinia]SFW58253.1 hypothetical protein SAMN03159384_03026 [Burkholderia sp. NFACC33-1]SFY11504.1 hypothetical protein SAMN03159408_03238 [Burkholderia sp. NFPP32]
MKHESDHAAVGGDSKMDKGRLERIWDEVQAMNRAAGPWGIFGKRKEA